MVTKNTEMRGAPRGEEEDEGVTSSWYIGVIFSDVFTVLSRHDSLKEDLLSLLDIIYLW